MKPFKYTNLGTMATVGRNHAVTEIKKMKIYGFLAWFMWLMIHLRPILGVRNKISVMFNWFVNYMSYNQSYRIIVYARKAKEVLEREDMLRQKHTGKDLL